MSIVSDDQIAGMTSDERRELISRLAGAEAPPMSDKQLRRLRWRVRSVLAGGVIVLVGWIGYLWATLPSQYHADHWRAVWTGFDLALVAAFACTLVLAILRRQLVLLAFVVSSVLLLCDAWFDVLTSGRHDIWPAAASAVFVEVPVAVLLFSAALRMLKDLATWHGQLGQGEHLWQARIPMYDAVGRRPTAR